MNLVERLRDENYRGAFQHLRNCTEIDSLFSEAAAEIERLQKEIETAREALEDIANDKLSDETWPEHYWRLVEIARRATKGGRE